MAPTRPQIQVRDFANPSDAEFIVGSFDSVLPYLEGIGSVGQWGTQPFSERTGFREDIDEWITVSERYRLTGEGEARRLFIAEVEVTPDDDSVGDKNDGENADVDAAAEDGPDGRGPHNRRDGPDDAGGRRYLQLAVLTVRDRWFPEYVKMQPQLAATIAAASADDGSGGNGNWVYIEVLISDYRTGPVRKGSGAALMRRALEYAIAQGARTLFVDCWSGNGDKLCRFYESFGFKVVDDFVLERPKGPWPGKLLRMDLE